MSRWFEKIIEKIAPESEKPIIVIDSQKYLEITELQDILKEKQKQLILVSPSIQVRMKYELEVKDKKNIILGILGKYELIDDIKESATVITLRPKEIFRNFDEKAIEGLSYNALTIVDSINFYQELTFEESVKFLLENLYGIDLQAWQQNKSKERILAILITIYTNNILPNEAINNFVYSMAEPYFGKQIKELRNREKIIDFIKNINPDSINLDNPILAKEIATLKINNEIEEAIQTPEVNNITIINELISFLEEKITSIGNQYKDWFELAPKLGELGYYIYNSNNPELEEKYTFLVSKINNKFQFFLDNQYETLFSMNPNIHPKTIDKVQDFIAANNKNNKIAFIVIDGMNYWQWTMLKHSLLKNKINVEDKPTLSWLPSITAWARQSIFRGEKPDLSIDNSTEGKLFKKYWIENHNKQDYQISYTKVQTSDTLQLPDTNVTVAGYVFNALDDMMHGTILGFKQLFLSTKLWIEQSNICKSIIDLKNAGFSIFISTDHGNIDATLSLKLAANQKALMHSRSKRFVQFDTDEQATSFIEAHKDYNLGKRNKCVYFKDSNGFGTSNQTEITHGGSHILELLIPVGIIK